LLVCTWEERPSPASLLGFFFKTILELVAMKEKKRICRDQLEKDDNCSNDDEDP
jgi:hypothetical protein